MELKTNYQYTHFIHPFIVKDSKYQKFILKMLKDKECKLKRLKKKKTWNYTNTFHQKWEIFYFQALALQMQNIADLKNYQ